MADENEIQQNEAAEEVIEDIDIESGVEARFKKLRDALKQCEQERREYLDGWQRARADHLNYKKNEAERIEGLGRLVAVNLIHDILPILDSFDRALEQELPPEVKQGVELIKSQFIDALKKHGVAEISVKPGDVFDPEIHESVGVVSSGFPAGAVAQIHQKGYLLHERVLRPVRVILSNNEKSSPENSETSEDTENG